VTGIGGAVSGAGRTIAQGGMEISGPDAKWLVSRTLVNAGTAVVTAPRFELNLGARLENLAGATFDIQSDPVISFTGGVIANAGTLGKSAGAGTADINIFLENAGVVEVQSGTFRLAQAGSTSTGRFAVAAGATLEFYSGTHRLAATSDVSGEGGVRFPYVAAVTVAGG